ncbi:DUF5132 domain-containing protein [Myxococcus sp. K15C18031901]|uniref:DUF5132 domain-containing protein n=1 Tax=Myxococcus dinghuensis TaxID=2906761 RepID=UPI0020A7374B|nr:DUF5132 domain-containing protein [Myxococcus dinghuensis]MCP3101651.1 DUF5132 domain-containing protein [Myxococcus dinghuensis]
MNRPFIALTSFALGAIVGAQLDREELRKKLRPLAESALKNGKAVGAELRRQAARFVEDLEDLVAEMMAEQETASAPPGEDASGPDSPSSA